MKKAVLIVVDSLHSHFGSQNYSLFLNKLANESVVFDNAYCQAHPTKPSISSILSSKYAFEHGVYGIYSKLDPKLCLVQNLLSAGIETGFIGGAIHITKDQGYTGFKHHIILDVDERKMIDPEYSHSKSIFDEAKEFILRYKNKQFFLYLHVLDVHTLDKNIIKTKEEYKKFYSQGLEKFDKNLKEFFDFFKQQELFSDTMFIITADNGNEYEIDENFENCFSQNTLKIPLIVYWSNQKGKEKKIAESIDILPTFFEFFKIPLPKVSGVSLFSKLEKKIAKSEYNSKHHTAYAPGFYFYGEISKKEKKFLQKIIGPAKKTKEHGFVSFVQENIKSTINILRFYLKHRSTKAVFLSELDEEGFEKNTRKISTDDLIGPQIKKIQKTRVALHIKSELKKMGYVK